MCHIFLYEVVRGANCRVMSYAVQLYCSGCTSAPRTREFSTNHRRRHKRGNCNILSVQYQYWQMARLCPNICHPVDRSWQNLAFLLSPIISAMSREGVGNNEQRWISIHIEFCWILHVWSFAFWPGPLLSNVWWKGFRLKLSTNLQGKCKFQKHKYSLNVFSNVFF